MDDAALVLDLLDLVGIVKADPAVAQGVEMVVVGVLVKGHQGVGAVAGVEDLAGAKVDLEDGRTAGNGAGNRHVGHDFLGGGSGQLAEKGPDRLNAILGIAGQTDDGIADVGRGGRWGCLRHILEN